MARGIVMDEQRATRIYENTVVFGECYTCGLPVAMTKYQRREYDECGATMWCSQGHQTVRTEPELTKAKRQLKEAQDKTTKAETQRDDYMNLMDVEVKKRLKVERRIKAGVCPECRRTFQNVHRHMASQHHG